MEVIKDFLKPYLKVGECEDPVLCLIPNLFFLQSVTQIRQDV